MQIAITCESSADLNKELYEKNEIKVLPFTITLGDKDYKDFTNLSPEMIFDFVAKEKTLPKTSAINEVEYSEFFSENIKADGLIHFCISSKISSTYNNAIMASKKFKNVYVVDSLSLSSGIGIQVLYACKLLKQGLTAEEIFNKVNERRKAVQISFCTYKLDYLHKGGRCSAISYLGANFLQIHPTIELKNGIMQIGKKYMGKHEKVVLKYTNEILNEFNTPNTEFACITCSSNSPELYEIVKNATEERVKFDTIYETRAGATVASHCGEKTIGLIYYNDGDNEIPKVRFF